MTTSSDELSSAYDVVFWVVVGICACVSLILIVVLGSIVIYTKYMAYRAMLEPKRKPVNALFQGIAKMEMITT